jgi:hypothetical protein
VQGEVETRSARQSDWVIEPAIAFTFILVANWLEIIPD